MTTLEDVRKSLIKEESFQEKELKELGEKIAKICTLDKDGNALFHRDLSEKDKIKYFLTARFIARKIEDFFEDIPEEKKIKAEVKKKEIARLLKKPKEQIRARLSDLRKEGLIEDIDRNTHKINALKVYEIVKELDKND
ncbi:MAG: hypothetical protein J7J38_00335 [Candidatus Aenigmarchaeota archaeon]|nr:hypothetical protein [Candidatus Aenigmarchaeota archaeon]